MSEADSDLQFDNGDQQFIEEDQDNQVHSNNQQNYHEENQIDRYKQQVDYELDQSFQTDNDALTRVKAKIMFNINKQRQQQNISVLYQDLTLTSIAMQYAKTIKQGQTDQAYLNRLNEQQKFYLGYETCQIISRYEDDTAVTKKYMEKYFIQNAYLFFEMDLQRQILMESGETHIGIGLAGSEKYIAIVILVTRRDLAITKIQQIQQDKVEVQGKILFPNNYISLTEVYDRNDAQLCFSMYDRVDFNRQTRDFSVKLDIKANWDQKRWIRIFTSANQQIGVRKPQKQKKNRLKKDSNDKFLSLFHNYPDQQFIQYYNQQVQSEYNTNNNPMLLQSLHGMEMKQQQKQDEDSEKDSNMIKSSQKQQSDHQSESQREITENIQLSKQQRTSNREIKQELLGAINQAKAAYQSVKNTNQRLQTKIKEIRDKNNVVIDKIGQSSMNQHKYLNILAQVHQTRMQLQLTQKRYNDMSMELQNKLSEKQAKCNDIRSAFQDLKKEVAKKATYSRSDQPIKSYKIEQWEQRQSKLAEQLQNLRLEILRARNVLSKNQKMLKKRQQLAQGLHLIDFQQLKIQNQTLNERIQERNQDLHKLKKKTTTMIQILTHTREKLVFVQKNKADLFESNGKLDQDIRTFRGKINSFKDQCEKLRLQIQAAKEETQILNSQELVMDFKKRTQNIGKLEDEMKDMLERERDMKTVIEMYQRKAKKDSMGR